MESPPSPCGEVDTAGKSHNALMDMGGPVIARESREKSRRLLPGLLRPSRRNRVAILRSRNRRRSPPGGRRADLPGARRAFVQVDRVARHRPPAPASPVPVRLCRLRRTQTNEAEAVTPVREVTTTDDTIM